MSYQLIARTAAVVQHKASKQKVHVELQNTNDKSMGHSGYKNTEELRIATFEGRFKLDTGEGRQVSGLVTVFVEYENGLDGVDEIAIRDSSVTPASCQILELPEFEAVEHGYSPLDP